MQVFIAIFLTGIGATFVVDVWALLRRTAFGTPLPDYALVGRWFGYLLRGRIRHACIASTPVLPGECITGWIVHYVVGVLFACILVGVSGVAWICHPTPGPALIVGVTTVLAPWLVLQPALGAGVAARLTPRPHAARIQGLLTHFWFGLGMYASAKVLQPVLCF